MERLSIIAEAILHPVFFRKIESRPPRVEESAIKSAFNTKSAESSMRVKNLTVSPIVVIVGLSSIRPKIKIKSAVKSITFILHIKRREFIPQKYGISSVIKKIVHNSSGLNQDEEKEKRSIPNSRTSGFTFTLAMSSPQMVFVVGRSCFLLDHLAYLCSCLLPLFLHL